MIRSLKVDPTGRTIYEVALRGCSSPLILRSLDTILTAYSGI